MSLQHGVAGVSANRQRTARSSAAALEVEKYLAASRSVTFGFDPLIEGDNHKQLRGRRRCWPGRTKGAGYRGVAGAQALARRFPGAQLEAYLAMGHEMQRQLRAAAAPHTEAGAPRT